MNQASLVAGMLAGRIALRRSNPDLLEWSHRQWELWLKRQHRKRANRAGNRIIAVASLSCLDDLPLHIGLMQLLVAPVYDATVILSLPTEEAARLALSQARREGWNGLVGVIAERNAVELLARLPGGAELAVFPMPGILPAPLRESLGKTGNSGDAPPSIEVMHDQNLFLGPAQNYSKWLRANGHVTEGQIAAAIRLVLGQDAGSLLSMAEDPTRPASICEPAGSWRGRVHPLEGRVDITGVGEADEIVVSAHCNGDWDVIARRRGDILSSDRRLQIRVPANLLTIMPRSIRMEVLKADGTATSTDLSFHVPPSQLKPWMVSAFMNRGGGGNPMIRAFAQAISCRIAYAEDEPDVLQDIPLVWGVLRDSDRILAQARAQALYYFYVDHAYFNRGHGQAYRITRNAYEAGPIRKCPDDRVSALGLAISPWRKGGRNIIVCPPTDFFMQAHGCPDWLESTLATLRTVTDRPIVVRQKPQPGEPAVPLEEALEKAHALVTHSSNVAIEAACLGTPVFVSPASAAAPIGRTDLSAIEDPVYPDRVPWLAHLAYNQFSFEEILGGQAWRMLLELEERELV